MEETITKVATKSDNHERAERITSVVEMLVQGASRYQIVQYSAATWGINQRQTDDYLKWAREEIRNSGAYDRSEEIEKAIRRYTEIHRRAMNPAPQPLMKDGEPLLLDDKPIMRKGKPDFHAANEAQKSLCRLLGLDAPKVLKHEVGSPGEFDAKDYSSKDLRDMLEQLRLSKSGVSDSGEIVAEKVLI